MLKTLGTLFICLLFLGSPLAAQQFCTPLSALMEIVREKELNVLVELEGNGGSIIVLSDTETREWTLWRTDGTTACFLVDGSGYTVAYLTPNV